MRASGSEDSSLNWFAGSKPASALSVELMKRFMGAGRTSPFLPHHPIAMFEGWRDCSRGIREGGTRIRFIDEWPWITKGAYG
jgi:hypothetical protein